MFDSMNLQDKTFAKDDGRDQASNHRPSDEKVQRANHYTTAFLDLPKLITFYGKPAEPGPNNGRNSCPRLKDHYLFICCFW